MARLSRRGSIADAYQAPAGGGVAFVQQASGSTGDTPSASVPATLDDASTPGNQLLLAVTSDATVSTPSGWALVVSRVNINGHYLFSKTSAGETTVTVNPGASAATSWWIYECSGLDISSALATASADTASGTPSTQSTGTTGSTSGATGGLAVAAWGSSKFGTPTVTTDAMTNGFAEQADVTTTSASRIQLAVGTLTPVADGTFTSTETLSTGVFAIGGLIAVFAPA